jgi:hypothetical protein
MRAALLEADWQRTVIEAAHVLGWRVGHFRKARTNKGWRTPVSADGKGFPDLVLVRDRIVYAELKSETGKPSLDQKAWRDAILGAGGEWYLWRPGDWEEVQRVLR